MTDNKRRRVPPAKNGAKAPKNNAVGDAERLAALPPIEHDRAKAKSAPLPELLLPAGSPDALAAAIEAGADAVYFGASAFSARARAVNFDADQAERAIALCRAYGVKAYAAVNTRIRDTETDEAIALVSMLYRAGVDAVIAADIGLTSRIREVFPDLELHASTQLTPVFRSDATALASLGFSRMVSPRELSYKELERLARTSPIEIEAFVHGAHCVSLSGQCLMSSLIGGRSANRGECAQPCRLPYKCGGREGYLLSLADMCYAADIPAIIASGVRSLKVEGRQKDENYVYGVGKIYRTLLDERRSATADEIAEMAMLFERGFTDGYLRRSFGGMCGVRRPDAVREKPFGGLKKKVPVSARLELYSDRPAKLTVTAPSASATAQSDSAPGIATGSPITEDRARAAVAKLGQTPFELRDFEFDTDGETWIAASELNDLRRRCAEEIMNVCKRTEKPGGKITGDPAPGDPAPGDPLSDKMFAPDEPLRMAEFATAEQITPAAIDYFDRLYLPYTEYDPDRDRPRNVSLSLPPYMTDELADSLRGIIRPGDRVLCHTVGQIGYVRSLGAAADASFRLNVFNTRCAAQIAGMTDGVVTLSPELNPSAMLDISRAVAMTGAVVYGKLPVMYTVRCMIRGKDCPNHGFGGQCGRIRETSACRAVFTDRTGARFPVIGGRDCANVVYNSVPLWMADRGDVLRRTGVAVEVFVFADEDRAAVDRVIRGYRCGESPAGGVRRVK